MRFSTIATAAAASSGALAAPTVEKRASINDGQILNYALTLEHLEDKFYRQALATFSQQDFANAGFGAQFYANLKEISSDETTHVGFLTSALQAAGVTPVPECKYSFPYSNPKQFVALSSILEGVGVSAYLGAARYIANKDYLTYAGSVLTVEARHNAYIRDKTGEIPFASPFDTPLDFNEVFTLAGSFITSCPGNNVTLPFKAFPSLSILNAPSPAKAGDMVNFITAAGTVLPKNVMAAWASVTGPILTNVTLSSNGQAAWTYIPEGIAGQSYVVIIKGSKFTDSAVQAGPAIIEVGPLEV